jgi:uncharacterized protein
VQLFALAVLGFVAAIVASVTGGGSLIMVPALMLSGMEPASAIATNMLVLTSLSFGAAARFRSAGAIALHPTLGLVLVSVPGSLAGALIAVGLNAELLRTIVAVAMVGMSLLILFQPSFGVRARPPSRRRRVAGYALLGAWSIYGGLFSGGYATVLTLGCTSLFGLKLLESVAVTRVVNLAGSLAATLVFAAQGKIDWIVGPPMTLAAFFGGWLGAALALRWGPQTIRRLLLVATVFMSGKLLHSALRAQSAPARDSVRTLAPR